MKHATKSDQSVVPDHRPEFELVTVAARRNHLTTHVAMRTIEQAGLPVLELGSKWKYTIKGGLDRLLADKIAGKQD